MADKSTPRNRSERRVTKTEAVSANGMVTAMHPHAAEAGLSVMKAGGNAADAAIAALLASGVVEPFMSGLGGAAYAVSYDSVRRNVRCYDGAVAVPSAAREDMFELVPKSDAEPGSGLYGWRPTKDSASELGPRAIGVPGALACLGRLHAERGHLAWKALFEPAIELADGGFAVDAYYFTNAAAAQAQLQRFSGAASLFLRGDGTAPAPPDGQLRLPALADTFRAIARDGVRAFYEGSLAEEIVSYVKERGGVLDRDDFTQYQPTAPTPVATSYHGFDAALLGVGSGGPTVVRALEELATAELNTFAFDEPRRFGAIARALRLAFSERLALRDGSSLDPATQHTTHVNAVDNQRNMVALTATLGGRFGSGVAVPALGVVLNNGMMWFDPEPGRHQSIRPGARALHAAAPAVLFDDGAPRAVLGAPGARRIMSAMVQVLVALIDHGMGPQQAVEAPRIHCEANENLTADVRLPDPVIEALRSEGFQVSLKADDLLQSHFGRPSVILVSKAGELRGGVEVHRAATAVGY